MRIKSPLSRKRSTYLAIAAAGAMTAGAFAANASAEEPSLGALITTVNCSTTATACVKGNNSNTGSGVTGTSKKGPGVLGQGTTSYGVKATSSSADGVFGSSTTGTAGVAGTTPSNYGVYGYTTSTSGGIGVVGSSSSSNGIGLYGSASGSGTGSYAYSPSGYGLEGVTSSGYGLYADAFGTGTGVYVTAGTGYGVISYSAGHVPFFGQNTNGNGLDVQGTYIGLIGRAPASGGFPLVLTDPSGNNLFYVDGAGNVNYKGNLNAFARLSGGGTVKSFSAKSTLPTVEDTGTAQLANGSAVVRLDPTFAATIDASDSYRVFVTPNGETHGLFVATKTAKGFIVREAQAGHANVSFDYRIVATALGQNGQRMGTLESSAAAPRAALSVAPKRPQARPGLGLP